MPPLQPIITFTAAVMLFVFGLHAFSHEIQSLGTEKLGRWLQMFTKNRFSGFLFGAVTTAAIQSSSAITSLTTAFVDASLISFRDSLGVMLGANVGTTMTAWLVSFKLTGMGSIIILLSVALRALPKRFAAFGKTVFYFGFVLFSLELISQNVQAFKQYPIFREALTLADQPLLGILMGAVITALIHASSVTTGAAIVLVQAGAIEPSAAINILIGANVGSTATALMASTTMGAAAKASARANSFFNAAGAILLLPFIGYFSKAVLAIASDPGQAIAWAHLLFNLGISVLFLPIIDFVAARFYKPAGRGAVQVNVSHSSQRLGVH